MHVAFLFGSAFVDCIVSVREGCGNGYCDERSSDTLRGVSCILSSLVGIGNGKTWKCKSIKVLQHNRLACVYFMQGPLWAEMKKYNQQIDLEIVPGSVKTSMAVYEGGGI